ncbi:MAG: triose-phosphate isomerase [Alphaproteobacteria bacterium]
MIAGNWKMNKVKDTSDFPEETYIENIVNAVSQNEKAVEISIFPPFSHIGMMVALADDKINVGAQDVSLNANGAFTGDVSVDLIQDVGANSAIVGHSERRTIHKETDGEVCTKAENLIKEGLTAVICIGETESENEAGKTMEVILSQFENSTPKDADAGQVVIAYEPVWAIGTGKTPTTEQIQDTHAQLRAGIEKSRGSDFAENVRLLYGGSVNPSNANEILSQSDVDGALVGGASLKSEDFINIIKSA